MSARSRYAPWFRVRRTMADVEKAACIHFGWAEPLRRDPAWEKAVGQHALMAFWQAWDAERDRAAAQWLDTWLGAIERDIAAEELSTGRAFGAGVRGHD